MHRTGCTDSRSKDVQPKNDNELRAKLSPQTDIGSGVWVDLAGLFAPDELVQKMLDDIETGAVDTLEKVKETFQSMYDNYPVYEWAWAAGVLGRELDKTFEQITAEDIIELTIKWKKAVVELDNMLYTDAGKEFAGTAQIGFGLDGSDECKRADFEQVRGTYDKNSFVLEIEKHIADKTRLGDELIGRMEKLR